MSQSLYWKTNGFSCSPKELNSILSERQIVINNDNNNDDNIHTPLNNVFYILNNYEYFNKINIKPNIDTNDLPEWYNNGKDDEIVEEMVDEYNILYDSTKTIEMEEYEYNNYKNNIEIIVSDNEHSSDEDEWTTVNS